MAEEQARMSDPGTGNRSPDEIRRDIERTRMDLHETVDAIERRLTPGELFDELWGRMRNSSGGGAGEVVKDHPVPIALMGLGLGWLAIEKATGNSTGSDRQYEDGPSVTFRPDSALEYEGDEPGRMDRMKEKASSLKDSASHLGDRASDVRDRVAETASSAGHRVSDAASEAKDRARETAEHAKDRARHTARRAQDRFERMSREQPLALGAITFGIGLAAGLMAPTTDWEDEHLGPASDSLKDTARETAGEVKDVASEVASEAKQVAREAKDSIEESARETEGQSIGHRIGDAVDRAKETAMHAASEHDIDREGLRDRGREVAEHAKDHAREARDEMRGSSTSESARYRGTPQDAGRTSRTQSTTERPDRAGRDDQTRR